MDTRTSFQVSAKLDNLSALRRRVEETAAALGADPAAIPDLIQAVDESATNIILHGYRGRPGMIEVEIEREKDRIVVRLRDQAPLFDPTKVPAPDLTLPLQERPKGGMGIYLSRTFTDRMTWRATPQGGNELTLIKIACPGPNKEKTNEHDHEPG